MLETLTLARVTVVGNTSSNHGGGISNNGTLTIVNSTIAGNNAQNLVVLTTHVGDAG